MRSGRLAEGASRARFEDRLPQSFTPLRVAAALLTVAGLSCAGGRASARGELEEMRSQLSAQADQIKQQGQRIEELELRVAAVGARAPAAPATAPAAAPSAGPPAPAAPAAITYPPQKGDPGDPSDVPPKLQTVKLHPQGGGRAQPRAPRANPVERAPRLPATVALQEPDADRLAELDQPLAADPVLREQAAGDRVFAQAVQQLNAGDYLSAQTSFLSFAHRWPRDASADNAVYFAGLARAASGDCAGALAQFDRVMRDYPAGDARVPARLEKGRCLLLLGRAAEGRSALQGLLDETPDALESQQARALLDSQAAREEGARPVR